MVASISVTRARQFQNDADGDGRPDPGDTFIHTIIIANGAGEDAVNVSLNETENGYTITPGSFKAGPIAIDDDLNVEIGPITGNTPIAFTAAALLSNDLDGDDATPSLTVVEIDGQPIFDNLGDPVEVTLTGGAGTVTHDGSGNFVYHPAPGFEGATSFTYGVEDADGITSVAATPGIVTFTVSDPVWYVDSANGNDATGDGTYENPFATLAPLTTGGSADGLDDDGDTIFVYNNGTINAGSIVLENGQSLLGDGSSLTSVNGNAVGASTSNSDIGGAAPGSFVVQLASGNEINGIDVLTTGANTTGISGTSFGTLTVNNTTVDTTWQAIALNTGNIAGGGFTSTDSDGGVGNVSLASVGGTLNLGTGTLAGATSGSLNISGGTVTVDYNGNISQAAGGAALNVTGGHNTGTVSLDGSVTATSGSGLQFNNADGTYNLNGVITLNGGTAGVDILNGSSGTFTFGTGGNLAAITHSAAGDAFVVDASDANVTFNGSITDNDGNAVNIANHDGGTITFQNGTISANGASAGGIDITDSNAGSVNFNGAVSLTTQGNTALNLTNNGGSSINFSGAGNGLDINTTTGNALVFTGGGELNISGAGNTIATTTGKMIDIVNGTTGTGVTFDTLSSTGLVNGHAVSLNNFDGDADANVEAFTANSISVAGTVVTSGGDGVNVSNGSSVRFDVNNVIVKNADGDGIELNGANGEVDIDTVNIQGVAGRGVHIVGATQLVDIDGGGIGVAVSPDPTANDPNQEAVLISGGSGNIDIGANIAKTTAGNIVEVQSHSSGTINFTGTISATGAFDNGILINNSGGTIAFTNGSKTLTTGINTAVQLSSNSANVDFTGGGLVINTTAGTGISGGSLITSTGGSVTVSGTGNTITATTGSALVLNGTDSDGLTFLSINKNGGSATAVYLKDAGSGGLTVTGTGSTANSGGMIQNVSGTDTNNTTGIGVYVENTNNISLSNMMFGNGTTLGNYSIRGVNVDNFTLRDSIINGTSGTTAAAENESAIFFTNLNGVGLFEGNSIGGGFTDNMRIQNNENGQTLNLFVRDSANDAALFGSTGLTNSGNDALNVQVSNDGNVKMLVTGVNFLAWRGDGIQASAFDTANLDVTVTNNSFTNAHPNIASAGGIGVLIGGTAGGGSWGVDYTVTGNTVTGAKGVAIAASFNGTSGTARGIISDNTIGTPGNGVFDGTGSSEAAGIFANIERIDGGVGLLTHLTTISGNTIRDVKQNGIFVASKNGASASNNAIIEATINNNTVAQMGGTSSIAGLLVQVAGAYDPGNVNDFAIARLDINNNNISIAGTTAAYAPIYFDQVFGSQGKFEFPGYGGTDGIDYPGGNHTDIRNYIVTTKGNVLTNDDVPLTGNTAETVWAPSARMDPGALQTAQTGSNTDLPTGAIQMPDPDGNSGSDGGAPQAPYVDPTPQSGPVADPNPVTPPSTGTGGTGGGTGGTDGGTTTPPAPPPAAHDLTQAQLDDIVDAAIQRWIAAGASDEQVAAMRATAFSVADMSGFVLGTSDGASVSIDSDGGGRGWFVDSTPGEDGEFGGSGSRLAADAGGPAAGRMDLLTVVMHELGHSIGLSDDYNRNEADELMYGYAFASERRLPQADDLIGADLGHSGHESFLLMPTNIPLIPENKAIKVVFTSTVNSISHQSITGPFHNLSTVDGDNFVTVQSAQEALDVDTLVLSGTIWIDDGGTTGIAANGQLDGDEAGVADVSVSVFADANNDNVADDPNTPLATVLTDGNGVYTFNLGPGNYVVRVDQLNFDAGGELENNQVSPVTSPDQPDPDNNTDGDDNGARTLGQPAWSKAITLAYDTEPTSDGGTPPKNDVNTTLDFAFIDNPPPEILDLGGDAVTFTEDGAAVKIDATTLASVTDDQANLNGGKLTVSITANEVGTEDVLGIFTLGGPGDIQLSDGTNVGSVVSIGIVAIGTISSNGRDGNDLVIDFDTNDATPANVTKLVQSLTYFNGNNVDPSALARTISVTVDDGLSGTDTETVTVNITTSNDAPVLLDTVVALDGVAEDAPAAGVGDGTLVSDLVDFATPSGGQDNIGPGDDGGTIGIAVTALDSTHGDWFYSTDGGANWTAAPTVADDSALLLLADADTRLYFRPDPNWNGTAAEAVTFRAWDGSTGSNGGTGDTTTNGGATPFSDTTDTASIIVSAVNDAPVRGGTGTVTLDPIVEDTPSGVAVSSFAASLFSDPNDDQTANGGSGPDNFAGIAVFINNSGPEGDWQYSTDGTTWTDIGAASSAASVLLDKDTQIRFNPAPEFNGPAPQLAFLLVDDSGGALTSGATADTTGAGGTSRYSADGVVLDQEVTEVNDAPTVAFAPSGSLPADGEFLVNTETSGSQFGPTVTGLADGGFIVTWFDYSGTLGDSSGASIKAQRFDADGNSVGGEFLVNSQTASDQFAPTVTQLADGNIVFSWYDTSGTLGDADESAIKARLFEADGDPVAGEFLVNNQTAGGQYGPIVTALSNGGFVVTWQDSSGTLGDADESAIKARLFEADGDPVAVEFLVNSETAGGQYSPATTALAGGGFVVTWTDYSGTLGDTESGSVKARIFADDGTPAGVEFLVNSETADDQSAPSVAGLEDGGFVVTWQDSSGTLGDADETSIKAQRYDSTGTPVGVEFLVNSQTGSSQLEPTVTAVAGGGFVITWRDNSGTLGDADASSIKGQQFDREGNPVGTEFLVNTETASLQFEPSAAGLADGSFVISWFDFSETLGDSSETSIKARLFDPAFVAVEQVALDLKGTIAIGDADSGASDITVTLAVDYGILTVVAGGSGADVVGSGSDEVTITGTLAEIEALLDADGTSVVTYTPDTDTPPASAQLTVTVNDGGASGGPAEETIGQATINIVAINDAPTLQLSDTGPGATLAYEEGDDATVLAPTAIFDDVDSPNFDGGTLVVQFDSGSEQAGDVLSILEVGDITLGATDEVLYDGTQIGTWSQTGNVITVDFDADADVEAVDALIQAIGYENTLDDPDNSSRFVNFKVTEADGKSAQGNATVNFTAVNDAPVLDLGGTIGTSEDAIDAWLSGMSISDPDADPATDEMVVTFAVGNGTLGIRTDVAGGVTAGDVSGGGTGTIIVTATLDQINATLSASNGLTYSPNPDFNGDDTLTVTANDQGATGADPNLTGDGSSEEATDTRTINVAPMPDPGTANNDAFSTPENANASGNLFADNGSGADADPDGLKIVAVNGVALDVGQEKPLAQGGLLRVNSNGTFTFKPNGDFDYLALSGSGAANTPATVTFNYTLEGGETATVTITVTGVDTNDLLIGTPNPDTMDGGGGNDEIWGLHGPDKLLGSGGDDLLIGDGGSDTLFGGADNDTLAGGTEDDLLRGGYGNDNADGGYGNDTVAGDEGNDNLFGGAGDDFVFGGIGDDFVRGGYGNDYLDGGDGNDIVIGDAGHDKLFGGGGDDVLDGGIGDDQLTGGYGNDRLDGAAGNDRLVGNDGNDTIFGEAGDDDLHGGNGDDFMRGGYGIDRIDGGAGADRLYGDDGDDTIVGEAGDDLLFGGKGNDVIQGGVGNDKLYGGAGNDTLNSGPGVDGFYFDSPLGPTNVDTIVGYSVAFDTIYLHRGVFSGVASGTLSSAAFHKGTQAADASDRIIYDQATGNIFYDADGAGGTAAILFATVQAGTALTNADFVGYVG